jgi:hypothetical protein
MKRPAVFLVAALVLATTGGTVAVRAALRLGGNEPSALRTASGTVSDAADTAGLVAAVQRWNGEPGKSTGQPVAARAADLLTDVGAAHDTLTAFPTTKDGVVCYHVHGAGSCGDLFLTPSHIVFGTLWIRGSGGRLFGVAADDVARVQVEIAGTSYDAILRNNGFYFQLPRGSGGADGQVVSTLDDGSRHVFPGHF